MRAMFAVISLGFVGTVGDAAKTIAKWEEKPFFARKAGQVVPPPAFFATTEEMPAGAEVRIKIVQCPKDAVLHVHRFIGGPVFSTGSKDYTDLSKGKTIVYKLDKAMKVGVTTSVGRQEGRCKSIDRKEGYDVLKYAFDKLEDMVVKVVVVGK